MGAKRAPARAEGAEGFAACAAGASGSPARGASECAGSTAGEVSGRMGPAGSGAPPFSPAAFDVPPRALAARIDRAEALRYLGYAGQEVGADLEQRMEAVMAACERGLAPRGLARAFAMGPRGGAGAPTRLEGTALELPGDDIADHLAGAVGAVVLCCTLGPASEQRLRARAATDPLGAAVYDAACSAYVEAAADALEDAVRARAEAAGFKLGGRFSPGYGDLPLGVQPALLATVDAGRRLGVSCAPSCMLVPSKSITAVAGVFTAQPPEGKRRPPCQVCRLRAGCVLRARGLTCDRR